MPKIAKTTSWLFEDIHSISRSFGETNDCTVKAIALACGVSYEVAHAAMKAAGRKEKKGAHATQMVTALNALGFTVRRWSFMEMREMVASYSGLGPNLQNITTHHTRRYPKSWARVADRKLMAFTTNWDHVLPIINGQVVDWTINKARRVIAIWEVTKKEA